jgi:hypothetical protein
MGPGTETGYAWEIDLGTLIGVAGGVVVNHSTLFGLAVGANVSHPEVNYSYFGFLSQYSHNPNKAIHGSAQVLLAGGSAKDYGW